MAHGRPAKKRRLTPPLDDDKQSETIKAKDLFSRAAEWDLEQDYERRPRKKKKERVNTRLPIVNAEGKLENAIVDTPASDEDVDSFLATDSNDESTNEETPPTEEVEEAPKIPLREQIIAAKEELARIALLLNEDPEEHAESFKTLGAIAKSASHPTIKKLTLAAQAAIYKDVIPGYRIRAYKDEELGNKVSKDVRKLRQYEHSLVTNYHTYVKDLAATAIAKDEAKDVAGPRSVAISCACTLLASVPHFNFRVDLLNLVVGQLSTKNYSQDYQRCTDALEAFFQADDDGAPSLEAVSLLTKMMKAKDYRIREQLLNIFFHLRLLRELSTKSSTTKADKPEEPQISGKKQKKEWQHRSKKERKVLKEKKAVEKDMKEADASVNYEAREKMQSETLKLVFTTYFRILKLRIPELMGSVLEGLAKFAHLINQDFFGDLLEALKDLVHQAEAPGPDSSPGNDDPNDSISRNFTRESLLSTQTAFTLLSHQDAAKSANSLSLDLSFFTAHIYRNLYPLSLSPDLELGPKSLHLLDPYTQQSPFKDQAHDQRSLINVQTPSLLLHRILASILLPINTHTSQISPTLLATFTKRLLTSTLQTPEKTTLAILSLITSITNKHGQKISPLWYTEERKGDGVFRGDADTVEATGVWSGGNVWEGELLRRHYVPRVREGWGEIDKIIRGNH